MTGIQTAALPGVAGLLVCVGVVARPTGFLAAVFLVLSCLVFGVFAGGFLSSKVFTSGAGMGWDRPAETLGGVVVGGLLGLIGGGLLLLELGRRERWIGGLLALLGALLSFLLVRVYPDPVRPEGDPPQPVGRLER